MSTESIDRLLPTSGPTHDYLLRAMRTAHLEETGTDDRWGMEAAYDALRAALAPAPAAGQKQEPSDV